MPQVYKAIQPMFKRNKWRICVNDIVCILRGPERGQTGKVLQIIKDRRLPQVIVEGRNMRKKKVPDGSGKDPDKDFFVVSMEAPLHYSNVQVLDPQTKQPVRVVFKYDETGNLVRCKKTDNPTSADLLPTPKEEEEGPSSDLTGSKDTPQELANKVTFTPGQAFPFRIRDVERQWAIANNQHMHYSYKDALPAQFHGAPVGSRGFACSALL